jgi:ribosome modulation factor
MNGDALTSVKMAFESGFKAALRGASIDSCAFKNPLHVVAFNRGWQRAKQLKEKGK